MDKKQHTFFPTRIQQVQLNLAMNTEILHLLRQKYPQIAEKALQEEIATVGKLLHFKAGAVLMEVGNYIKIAPLVIEGVIKVSREDEEGNEESDEEMEE